MVDPLELILAHQRRVDELNGGPESLQVPPDIEPLEFFMAIMRDNRQPMARRMRAGEIAAQYRHAKLGAVATTTLNSQDFAELLERAILRTRGTYSKLIEHQPTED